VCVAYTCVYIYIYIYIYIYMHICIHIYMRAPCNYSLVLPPTPHWNLAVARGAPGNLALRVTDDDSVVFCQKRGRTTIATPPTYLALPRGSRAADSAVNARAREMRGSHPPPPPLLYTSPARGSRGESAADFTNVCARRPTHTHTHIYIYIYIYVYI